MDAGRHQLSRFARQVATALRDVTLAFLWADDLVSSDVAKAVGEHLQYV
jgi:hypothetical protein